MTSECELQEGIGALVPLPQVAGAQPLRQRRHDGGEEPNSTRRVPAIGLAAAEEQPRTIRNSFPSRQRRMNGDLPPADRSGTPLARSRLLTVPAG